MNKIKTLIAAGGLGKRLQGFRDNDLTKVLLEVNGTPMINLQIERLLNYGLDEFIIITNPIFDKEIRKSTQILTNNCKLEYVIQEEPKGISHAFYQSKNFIKKNDILVCVLGDNFFGSNPLKFVNFSEINSSEFSYIFTKEVDNPSEFGIAEINNKNEVVIIEEKPINPISSKAVVGFYIFDYSALDKIETLKPSQRGEYEITDLINIYIRNKNCKNFSIEDWWIDAGTPERIIELESKIL